jgi:hypothetical protein
MLSPFVFLGLGASVTRPAVTGTLPSLRYTSQKARFAKEPSIPARKLAGQTGLQRVPSHSYMDTEASSAQESSAGDGLRDYLLVLPSVMKQVGRNETLGLGPRVTV